MSSSATFLLLIGSILFWGAVAWVCTLVTGDTWASTLLAVSVAYLMNAGLSAGDDGM